MITLWFICIYMYLLTGRPIILAKSAGWLPRSGKMSKIQTKNWFQQVCSDRSIKRRFTTPEGNYHRQTNQPIYQPTISNGHPDMGVHREVILELSRDTYLSYNYTLSFIYLSRKSDWFLIYQISSSSSLKIKQITSKYQEEFLKASRIFKG